MPEKEIVIQMLELFRNRSSAAQIASSTKTPLGTTRRYIRFFGLLKRGISDPEISRMLELNEDTVYEMRRWVNNAAPDLFDAQVKTDDDVGEKVLVPKSTEEDEAVAGAKARHLEMLAVFASDIANSLAVPTPTSVSGVEQDHWTDPYSGILVKVPSIRAITQGDGQSHYRALLEHLPMVGLDSAFKGLCFSFHAYARSTSSLVDRIRRLYNERGVDSKSEPVPPGLLLGALHFGLEAAESGRPTAVVPVVERNPDGSADIRIGGWSAPFRDSNMAHTAFTIFEDVVQRIAGTTEMRAWLAARTNCGTSIGELCRLLSPEDRVMIAISKTSCEMCTAADQAG